MTGGCDSSSSIPLATLAILTGSGVTAPAAGATGAAYFLNFDNFYNLNNVLWPFFSFF